MSSAKSLKLVHSNQESAAVTKNIRFSLIHDSIDDQSWSDDPYCMLVVQYLIRKAAYSKHTRKYGKHTEELQLGQFITSHLNLAKLSTVYGLYKSSKNPEAAAKSAIDRVLKMLEKDGFLSKVVLGKGKDQCSVLTVVNWAKFQSNKVSILKTIPKTLNETIEKTKETHIQHSLQADIKTIEKTNVETLAKANTNKVVKQQRDIVSKDTCQNSDEFQPTKQPKIPNQEIVDLFAEILPALPQPKKLTSARLKSMKARHVNDLKKDLNNWRKYFQYIADSCSWMTSGQYNVDFDYVIRQSTFVKVLEGAKNDRT